MQKLIFLFIAIFASPLSANTTFNDFFTNLKTLKANFIQENININELLVEKSTGILILKRPNQLYWEVKSPNHQILILNKKSLLVYDVDLEQASKQTTEQFKSSPLSWLLKNKTQQLPKFITKRNGISWFMIEDAKGNFQKVLFGFQNQKLIQLKLLNDNGTLFIKFDKLEINSAIDDSIFNLTLPDDVDVIK